jgi:CheY-like chemotaxis protein
VVFPHAGHDATLQRGRVLVVEDNSTNQLVAVGILAHLGWSADVAADGLAAIAAVEQLRYDAVLMDCQMPNMDGYTCTAEIRRREGTNQRVPIIAMTASAVTGDRERCLAAGMDDYVAKPVTPEDVDEVLTRWITTSDSVSKPPPQRQIEPDVNRGDNVVQSGSQPTVDLERVDVLRKIGTPPGELLTRMVDAFVVEFPNNLAELRDAATNMNGAVITQAAHRLKGAAANLGATSIAELCAALEQAAASDLASAPSLLELIATEFDSTRLALNSVCETVLL